MHVSQYVFPKVEQRNPSVFLHHIVTPLFVVGIVAVMKVQHVLANEHKLGHPAIPKRVDDLPFEQHDVVEEAVVPLANEFQNGMPFVVICVEHFGVEGLASEFIPLRMDVVVVHLQVVGKFIVHAVVERTLRVVARDVVVAPGVVWFKCVHGPVDVRRPQLERCRTRSKALRIPPIQVRWLRPPSARRAA